MFDVPPKLLSDKYKGKTDITQRFGDPGAERIPVKNIAVPDLSSIQTLGRDDNFSLFIPRHRELAAQLIHIFMGKHQIFHTIEIT